MKQAAEMRSRMESQTTRIDITVTPTGGAGPNVECDITGPADYVTDHAIFLPLNSGDFEIYFTLDPGPQSLSWNANPFAAHVGKCPKGPTPPPNQPQGQFTPDAPNGSVLRVQATGQSKRSVAFYKLNFNGGNSCDPIIINGGGTNIIGGGNN